MPAVDHRGRRPAASRKPDLYLLCDIDVPWVADGVRDRGERREEMQGLFRDAVAKSEVPFIELRGDAAARLGLARLAIQSLLSAEPRKPGGHTD